jgi:hypothetical protein
VCLGELSRCVSAGLGDAQLIVDLLLRDVIIEMCGHGWVLKRLM